MAHFAEIDDNNIVVRVLVVPDEQAHRGQDFLANDLGLGGTWIETSYNTVDGVHYEPDSRTPSQSQDKAKRKQFAGVGMTYDPNRDMFIPPKMYPSWVFDEVKGNWKPPKERPAQAGPWSWDEATLSWVDATPTE